jgi:hypothetical protein
MKERGSLHGDDGIRGKNVKCDGVNLPIIRYIHDVVDDKGRPVEKGLKGEIIFGRGGIAVRRRLDSNELKSDFSTE